MQRKNEGKGKKNYPMEWNMFFKVLDKLKFMKALCGQSIILCDVLLHWINCLVWLCLALYLWSFVILYGLIDPNSFGLVIDHRQQWKWNKYEIRFTWKTTFFWRDFQTLNSRPAVTALSSNVRQFCKPKSSCFMRETAVKRISFFLEFLIVYEVYRLFFWIS